MLIPVPSAEMAPLLPILPVKVPSSATLPDVDAGIGDRRDVAIVGNAAGKIELPTSVMSMPVICAEIAPALLILPMKLPSWATSEIKIPFPVAATILPLLLMPPEKRERPTSLIFIPVPWAEITPVLSMVPLKVPPVAKSTEETTIASAVVDVSAPLLMMLPAKTVTCWTAISAALASIGPELFTPPLKSASLSTTMPIAASIVPALSMPPAKVETAATSMPIPIKPPALTMPKLLIPPENFDSNLTTMPSPVAAVPVVMIPAAPLMIPLTTFDLSIALSSTGDDDSIADNVYCPVVGNLAVDRAVVLDQNTGPARRIAIVPVLSRLPVNVLSLTMIAVVTPLLFFGNGPV